MFARYASNYNLNKQVKRVNWVFTFPITFLLILMNMVKVYWYCISICYIIFFYSCAIYSVCPLFWRSHSSNKIIFHNYGCLFFSLLLFLNVSDPIKCLRKLWVLFKHNWLHPQCYLVIYWPEFPYFAIFHLLLSLRKFKAVSVGLIMNVTT